MKITPKTEELTPVAVSSSAKVIAQENQYTHDMLKPRLGSTKRKAY